jgi:hypothetical protein
MHTISYPARAGHKVGGAAELAAVAVDEGPNRLLRVMTEILFATSVDGSMCADELAGIVEEPILYTRPRCSQMIALGLLRQASMKTSPTCGRQAHTLLPVDWVATRLDRCRSDDERLAVCERIVLKARADAEMPKKPKERAPTLTEVLAAL